MDDSVALMQGAKRLRFPDALEQMFCGDYYGNSVAISRAALLASMLIWPLFGLLDPYAVPSETHAIWLIRYGLVSPVQLIVFVLSFFPIFRKVMQLAISLEMFVVGLAVIAITAKARPGDLGYIFYPMGLLLTPLLGYSFFRLRFWYATIPNLMVAVFYVFFAIFYQDVLADPQELKVFINNTFYIVAINFAGITTCYSLELYARRSFVANYLLDQERAGEKRKRERTEAMLHVLSQAIGGVVHDLGNPLTSVQLGAQTLDLFLDSGHANPEDLKEFTGIIKDGAEMLNYLRLSLMEQTRVLEGKPIPVELQPASVRRIAEAGVQFQKPRFASGRRIPLDGEDVEVLVDEKKLITVLMNLVGNALKYSDGEVHISWRTGQGTVLIAVADQGVAGTGISKAQADQLFVAFGRLDAHAEVEGTGLGLLSVRKIVEAHGGEVFIEGHVDGTSDSAPFSTAQHDYASMLAESQRTAFVIACPLDPQSQPGSADEEDALWAFDTASQSR